MKRFFNSKVFSVAMIPFYGYLLISIYVLVRAEFRLDVLDLHSIAFLSAGLILSALLYSMNFHITHIIALCMMLLLGSYGLYVAVMLDPVNWMELFASILIIVFNCAFYQMVKRHHEEPNEAY